MTPQEAKLLKVKDVMDILGVSRNTVYKWVAQGKLEGAFQIGDAGEIRIPNTALSVFLDTSEAETSHEVEPEDDFIDGPSMSSIRNRIRAIQGDITVVLQLLESAEDQKEVRM